MEEAGAGGTSGSTRPARVASAGGCGRLTRVAPAALRGRSGWCPLVAAGGWSGRQREAGAGGTDSYGRPTLLTARIDVVTARRLAVGVSQ